MGGLTLNQIQQKEVGDYEEDRCCRFGGFGAHRRVCLRPERAGSGYDGGQEFVVAAFDLELGGLLSLELLEQRFRKLPGLPERLWLGRLRNGLGVGARISWVFKPLSKSSSTRAADPKKVGIRHMANLRGWPDKRMLFARLQAARNQGTQERRSR